MTSKDNRMILMGYGVLVVAMIAFGVVLILGNNQPPDSSFESKIHWQPYSAEQVAAAKQAGKPVMIDFFAIWCGPCRQMDGKVFSRQDVADAATNFVALRVDVSNEANEANRKVAEQYSITGLPTLVFLGTDGEERIRLRLLGYEPGEKLIPRLKAVQ